MVIVGNLADTVTLGDYSGDPSLQVNAVQGITAAVQAANPNAQVTYDSCGTSTTATVAADCSAATLAAIKSASLVIVVVGTDLNVASEGNDRASLAMPGNYDSLISQVNAVGNPNMALVIQSNGPVDLGDVQGDFPAIVFSGYNGESQGTALAQVLFGQQNPSGHLDFTWYADDSQLPDIANYGLTPSQTGGLGRTYMYFTGTPTYPFGYGLSYTSFKYSHVQVGPRAATANGTVAVSFDVTNTGKTAGTTVAQVYTSPRMTVPGTELPRDQLTGFQRTADLRPGQTQHLTVRVKISSLSEWDEQALKQVVYDGSYEFFVGPDSATAGGSGTVAVHGAINPRVQDVTVQPDQVVFQALGPDAQPDRHQLLDRPGHRHRTRAAARERRQHRRGGQRRRVVREPLAGACQVLKQRPVRRERQLQRRGAGGQGRRRDDQGHGQRRHGHRGHRGPGHADELDAGRRPRRSGVNGERDVHERRRRPGL